MSAYLVYRTAEPNRASMATNGHATAPFEYTVVSNIYSGGLPALEAGAVIVEKAVQILTNHAAGNRLEALLKSGS